MNPFVKWAGGKRQLLSKIIEIIRILEEETDKNNYTFFEPFVGGGIVFLRLKHNNVVINDLNSELMNAYKIVLNSPDILMKKLDEHLEKYIEDNDYYYEIRSLDRDPEKLNELTNVEKAARMIFLNKTCYNGLYRVNSHGQFNTPRGRYKNPKLYNRDNILKIQHYLKNSNIEIQNEDYSTTLKKVKEGDIIYVDPPYDYGDEKGFTQYQLDGFTFEDFKRLKKKLDKCINKGAYVIISNNETKRIVELFGNDPRYKIYYEVKRFKTNRTINSKTSNRKSGREIIIVGMKLNLPQAISLEKVMRLIRIKDMDKLKNDDEIRKLLDIRGVSTINNYLSALRYLNLINAKNEFTENAINLRSLSRTAFEVELAKIIIEETLFKECYETEIRNQKRLEQEEIIAILSNKYKKKSAKKISMSASTMRNWLSWCHKTLSHDE